MSQSKNDKECIKFPDRHDEGKKRSGGKTARGEKGTLRAEGKRPQLRKPGGGKRMEEYLELNFKRGKQAIFHSLSTSGDDFGWKREGIKF